MIIVYKNLCFGDKILYDGKEYIIDFDVWQTLCFDPRVKFVWE